MFCCSAFHGVRFRFCFFGRVRFFSLPKMIECEKVVVDMRLVKTAIVGALLLSLFTRLYVPVWIISGLALVFVLYVYGTWYHGFFTSMNVSGPKPIPVMGNLPLFAKNGYVIDRELSKIYGRVFGIFEGFRPVLVISDADLIQQITITHFDKFFNHRIVLLNKEMQKAVFALNKDDWKVMRSVMGPSMTCHQLKNITPAINECAKRMVQLLDQYLEKQSIVDMRDITGCFTMNVIAETQFGIRITSPPCINRCQFVENAQKALDNWNIENPAILLALCFPFMEPILQFFGWGQFSSEQLRFFEHQIRWIISERNAMESRPADFMQLLLDAEAKLGLCKEEIFGSCVTFFLAGYGTTASTLAFMMYNLALNPEIEDKLHKEILNIVKDSDVITYEMASKMRYLEQVLDETMRLFPPVMRTDRICEKACQIGPYSFSQGQVVNISIIALHYDEEYWPEPDKFDPDRFSAENKAIRKTGAFCPFGAGPRICVGKALAVFELKIAAAYLLRNFCFARCEKTEVPFLLNSSTLAMPKNGIFLNVKRKW